MNIIAKLLAQQRFPQPDAETFGEEVSWQSLPRRHIRRPSFDQSGFAPENFTTFAHFSLSSAMNFPNAAGVIGTGTPPSSASRVSSFGSASTAFTALLSVSTISDGVPLGATMPYHTTAS